MSRSVYLHEGLDFPEHLEAGVDHGFNWLERRTLWRRSALYQSIALSLFVHIAAISMFISFPNTNDGVETPWVEVRLVSLGRGEIGDGVEQRGGAGGSPAGIWPTNFQVPASSVSPPEPVPEIAEKSREKDPKATINLASARSRSANKPKEPPKSSAPQGEARDIEPSSSFTSQPANATVSLPGNGGLGQALAESWRRWPRKGAARKRSLRCRIRRCRWSPVRSQEPAQISATGEAIGERSHCGPARNH